MDYHLIRWHARFTPHPAFAPAHVDPLPLNGGGEGNGSRSRGEGTTGALLCELRCSFHSFVVRLFLVELRVMKATEEYAPIAGRFPLSLHFINARLNS